MQEAYALKYRAREFGVSREELQKVVDKVGIRPPPSARDWQCDPKARGMLAIFGARPARFSVTLRVPFP
jgi:hypothetical protein